MTDEQYAWLRSVLGERCPTEDEADDALDRLGSIRAVALEYLRRWRAELLSSAASVTIQGALSVSFAENIKAVERLIAEVTAGPDDPTLPPEPEPTSTLPVMGLGMFVADHSRGVDPQSVPWAR